MCNICVSFYVSVCKCCLCVFKCDYVCVALRVFLCMNLFLFKFVYVCVVMWVILCVNLCVCV